MTQKENTNSFNGLPYASSLLRINMTDILMQPEVTLLNSPSFLFLFLNQQWAFGRKWSSWRERLNEAHDQGMLGDPPSNCHLYQSVWKSSSWCTVHQRKGNLRVRQWKQAKDRGKAMRCVSSARICSYSFRVGVAYMKIERSIAAPPNQEIGISSCILSFYWFASKFFLVDCLVSCLLSLLAIESILMGLAQESCLMMKKFS